MSARPALRVIDGDGEVVEFTTAEEENKALRSALTRAERSNASLRAELASNLDKARKTHPIDDAFADWQTKVVAAGFKGKKQCKLSPDRIKAMNGMFEAGYTLDDFLLCNTGLAAFPFVVYGKRRESGSKDAVEVDIGHVCEKARRFEDAARLGYVVEHNRVVEMNRRA